MYKRKLPIPPNFMTCVKKYMSEFPSELLQEIDSIVVAKIINRYSMECRNVIIEIFTGSADELELSLRHDIPVECIRHYCNDLKWKIARYYKHNIDVEDKATIYLSVDEINAIPLFGTKISEKLTRKAFVALTRSNIETLGELLNLYETQRMRLFQSYIPGCTSEVIADLSEFCDTFIEIRKSFIPK